MYSQFLPQSFRTEKPIALIAGKELYPVLTAARIQKLKLPLRLVAFEGETRQDLIESVPEQDRTILKVGQLGKLLKALKQWDTGYTIMAGQITPKRLFKGLSPDFKAIAILATLKERNAETIFGAITSEIEKLGILQLDARVFLDDQLAEVGLMAGKKIPLKQEHIDYGIYIAKESAKLDIGQSVVVRKGTVIAVEAFEGTDAMLQRAGTFNADEALFIKTTKPHQDYRFDVPVFGIKTLETMIQAGIRNAALEANTTIILEKEKVLNQAKRQGITLWGY